MFVRALLAFLALPGVLAFALPALLAKGLGQRAHADPVGLLAAAIGLVGLLWCVADFYRVGKGTLAPWAPPRHLVTGGLYRYSRNPMYVAVLLLLAGWALIHRSLPLAGYALIVAIGFHLRVVWGEEPWLARTHGNAWEHYASSVPRWLW